MIAPLRFNLGPLALIIFVTRQKRFGVEGCLHVMVNLWFGPRKPVANSRALRRLRKKERECQPDFEPGGNWV